MVKDLASPGPSLAKSSLDLIGSGWAGLLTSWQPKHVLQNFSASLSTPGHHTFDCNLCFILTIPGCPSCASVRTRDLNLLGITILVPRRISLPITHSSLATGMYCLSWSFLQVPLIIQLRNSLNSSSADASSISRVVIARGVEVTATNRTNTSDTLCATVESAWFSSCSKRDSESAMFFSPGRYFTLKLYGCNLRIHRSILAQGFDLLEYIVSNGL